MVLDSVGSAFYRQRDARLATLMARITSSIVDAVLLCRHTEESILVAGCPTFGIRRFASTAGVSTLPDSESVVPPSSFIRGR